MQIKLKELLENMAAESGDAPAASPPGGDGVVDQTVEDGPSVATACPPTPRKAISAVQAAIDAASLDAEALEQADFFNPPEVDPAPRTTTELEAADVEEQVVSHRPHRRATPPPPPPRRDEADTEASPPVSIAEQPTAPAARASAAQPAAGDDEEYEPQTFSRGMLSPLSRRPSGVSEVVTAPPRRDSGLIDVRSMAAAYREYDGLVKKKEGRGADVETEPLPILGGEHTSPILLPQASAPSGPSRWLYAVVAVLGAIVLIGSTVAITALVLKRKADGGTSFAALAPDERAALCEEEAAAARLREEEEAARIAEARRAPAPAPAPAPAAVTAADVAGAAPVPVAAAAEPTRDDDDRSSRRDRDRDRDRDREGKGEAAEPPAQPVAASTPPPAAPAPAAPAPAKPAASDDLAAAAAAGSDGEECDEVTCLVSGKGCCGKAPKGGKGGGEAAPDPSLPARPEKADISAGVASVQNRLQSCGDRNGVRGAVTVKISIAPSGEVKSASTTQGNADFQSCIAGALRGARFPASQQGARVNYPVVLK